MPSKKNIMAVLFDFDGTLTMPGAIQFDVIKRLIRCPPDSPILEYIESLPSPAQTRSAMAVLEEHELAAARASRPRPYAETLLQKLAAAKMPMGILTRNSRASLEESIRHFKDITLDMFSVVLTRENVSRRKPHPEGVLRAAKQFNIAPAQMLVVGDYIFDIQAGQAAGAQTAFLKDEAASKHPNPPATFNIRSLAELDALLL